MFENAVAISDLSSLGDLLMRLADWHAATRWSINDSWLGRTPLCMLMSMPRYFAVSSLNPSVVSLARMVVNLVSRSIPLLSMAMALIENRSCDAAIISASCDEMLW